MKNLNFLGFFKNQVDQNDLIWLNPQFTFFSFHFSLCIFRRRLREKYLKVFFESIGQKKPKNSHDFDPCFSGKLRKDVSYVTYFKKEKKLSFKTKK